MRPIVTTTLVLVLAATTTTGFVAPTAPTIDGSDVGRDTQFVGELARGDALFWDGPYIDSVGTGTRVADPVLCDSPVATYLSCIATEPYPVSAQASAVSALFAGIAGPLCGIEHRCSSYAFDVVAEGEELRVAFDQPSLRDKFGMAVYDPDGELVALTGSPPGEVRIPDPAEGRWTVRLEAFDVRDSAVRMRAALDAGAATPGEDVRHEHGRDRSGGGPAELLPNLQVVPPYEVGFASCQPTEVVDYGAQRCLRFSAGPANVGDGPLDLIITEDGEITGQMYQRIHLDDGSHVVHEAGDFEWHPEHVHYHHGALQSLELYRVTDPRRGGLELAGVGPKLGFCLAPYHIAEWDSFAQDPPYSVYGDDACTSLDPPVATQMALARGWVDIYQWWIEGNFVDFGDNPDGLYVIRAASDPDGDILETDDGDNTAYTYVRVTGDHIEVLERGIGDDPWDRRKTVVDDIRRPTRWSDEAPVEAERVMAPQNIGATARDQMLNPDYLMRLREPGIDYALGTGEDWRYQLDVYRHDWDGTRGRMLETTFDNRYGATLEVRLFAPLERGNYPGLVFTPGYGSAGAWPPYWSLLQRIAEEGYVVAAVSPQGTGGSDVDPDPEFCGGDGSEWWRRPQEAGLVETHECAGHHSVPFENDPTGNILTAIAAVASGEEEFHAYLDEFYASFRPAYVFATIDTAHWLASPGNPLRAEVKRSRIGAFGHSAGADAATLSAAVDPLIDAGVALDGWGDAVPFAATGDPTLFVGATHFPPGYDVTPGRHRALDHADAYRDADVPSGVVLIDDAVHTDFSYHPWPFSAAFANQPHTRSVAHHYLLAWFDLHLQGDRTAAERLTAEVFDGSADRSSIGQGTYDPLTMSNVPYTLEGRPVSDFTGRRAPNSFWLP